MLGSPDYTGFIRNRNGYRVFIAFQGPDTATSPTITNNIEYLRAKHNVTLILYRDSTGHWDGWSDENGFIPLGIESQDCTDSLFNAFTLKLKLMGINPKK